jgi:4-amino-4-deoxy-L-arabinose transferase-like glycosyltransferase
MTQKRAQWGLVAVVAAFCVLGVVYSVVIPLFEAPDEIWHFSLLRLLATRWSLPVQPTDGKNMWLREAGQPPLYYLVTAPIVALLDTSDFPDFVRFNVAHPAVTAGSSSTSPNIFIHTPYEQFPYQGAVLAVHVVRLLSVLWGAMTVVSAFLVTRETVPSRPGLALAVASFTAFNPHFIFINSVVNNDGCTAGMCGLCVWLAVRVVRFEQEAGFCRRNLASLSVLGGGLGLALLTKMSALALLPLIALGLLLIWWRDRNIEALLIRGLVVFGLAALVGAWWYVRNWLLYGDPLGWGIWLIDIPIVRIGLIELVRQFGHVATSYWSPYDGLFPPSVFWALGLLAVMALVGLLRLAVQREARAGVYAEGLVLAGTWFVLLFISLIRYMRTTPSDEGRLLFPGIGAFALFLVLGVESAVGWRRAGAVTSGVGIGLLVLCCATPFFAIAPRFASPLVASVEGLAVEVSFDDASFAAQAEDVEQAYQVRLLGMEVSPDEIQAGDTVDVTLYWEAQSSPPAHLRAVVQIWTIGGRFLGQRDATPAGEVYPPDLWLPGDVVRDVYRVRVNEDGPAMCRVAVRVLTSDELLGEVSSPAVLRLTGPALSSDGVEYPLEYTFDGKIELIGYSLPNGPPSSASESLAIVFYWHALTEIDEDYTVFLHLLNEDRDGADSGLVGQSDGPPFDNDYPTSYWLPGQILGDVHVLSLDGARPANVYLLVGLYRLADGMRLPIHTATGERIPDDAIKLDIYGG